MALDAEAFTAFERTAHDSIAGRYAKVFTPLTCLALAPLLDATRVAAGQRLLDVGTGPGVAAAAARARGVAATGVDVSPGMIALARQEHPCIDFQVAEATELPFPDAMFESVICNFALSHFPKPDAALAECVRVLVPGGVLAFSWWDQPERQRVQGLFREVIAELALPPGPGVPQGHDTLRLFRCRSLRRAPARCRARWGGGGTAPHRSPHAGCGGAVAGGHGRHGGHRQRGGGPGCGHSGPSARLPRSASRDLPQLSGTGNTHRFPHRHRTKALTSRNAQLLVLSHAIGLATRLILSDAGLGGP